MASFAIKPGRSSQINPFWLTGPSPAFFWEQFPFECVWDKDGNVSGGVIRFS
jgi:hypothetical protein